MIHVGVHVEVTQGHWNWYRSVGHIQLTISDR